MSADHQPAVGDRLASELAASMPTLLAEIEAVLNEDPTDGDAA